MISCDQYGRFAGHPGYDFDASALRADDPIVKEGPSNYVPGNAGGANVLQTISLNVRVILMRGFMNVPDPHSARGRHLRAVVCSIYNIVYVFVVDVAPRRQGGSRFSADVLEAIARNRSASRAMNADAPDRKQIRIEIEIANDAVVTIVDAKHDRLVAVDCD